MLSVENLTIVQSGKRLWESVSFTLAPGERLGISAPSGFGKTTLGRVLAQWQSATAGHILLEGKPLAKKDIVRSNWFLSTQSKVLILIAPPVRAYMMPGGPMLIGWRGWRLILIGCNAGRMNYRVVNWPALLCYARWIHGRVI